jgi:outer membrane immunogenic protein
VKSLKIALLGATVLAGAGIVSAANAADVYERGGSYKDTPAYMPAITWSGFYAGVNVGAAFNDDDNEFDSVRLADDDDTTWLVGLHAGYNWQKPNNLVLGVEGDVSFGDDIDYLASLRGRIGLALGPTLLYATGGVAFIGYDDDFFDDDSETGWVAGLGIEHKLRDNVSIGLEGLYYAFDDREFAGFEEDADFWTVRARLTYHFGGRSEEALK